ncbi:MAG: hypothetical protein IPK87_09230 [Planctomycetes bacterium]|nr:hypothetical protein [Planctomycetota bacterium]
MTSMQYMIGLAFTGTMALAGAFAAVGIMQPTPVGAQEGIGAVKATEFQLVDKNGKVRIQLDVGESGDARFSMLDGKGAVRLQANSGGDQAYVSLLDGSGKIRYLVGHNLKDDMVMETYTDAEGRNRFISSLRKEGDAVITFANSEGKNVVTLMGGDELSSLQLAGGENLMQNSILKDGRAFFAMQNGKTVRWRGMIAADGTPSLDFLNAEKKATWSAGK